MTEDDVKQLLLDKRWLIENLLSIPNKDGRIVPFKFNRLQDDYWKKRTRRDIILKARQLGFTSMILADFLMDALMNKNFKVVLLAQDDVFATSLIRRCKMFWESMPKVVRIEGYVVRTVKNLETQHYSDHLITWPEIGSAIQAGTSGSTKFGRGDTIHRVLASEVAFWDEMVAESTLIAVESALPEDSRMVIECTANGASGTFYDRYQSAKLRETLYVPHFYHWGWDDEYKRAPDADDVHHDDRVYVPTEAEQRLMVRLSLSDDQVRFRRTMARTLKEKLLQEFPEDDITCFLVSGSTIFDQDNITFLIGRCRDPIWELRGLKQWQKAIPSEKYIIGADVSTAYGVDPTMKESQRKRLRLDYSAAVVLNMKTLEHVATLHGTWDSKSFADRLYELAVEYNKAFLVVEANGPGDSVLNTIVNQHNYHNIYYRIDTMTRTANRWGWWTDKASKPRMVDEFRGVLESGAFSTNDKRLLEEARMFAKLSPSSVGAPAGCHDDILMAAMMAVAVRGQVPRMGITISRR